MDPWQMPGKEFVRLSTYFAPGWLTALAIFTSAVYRPKPPAVRGPCGSNRASARGRKPQMKTRPINRPVPPPGGLTAPAAARPQ